MSSRHIRYWDLVLLDNDIDNAKSKQLSLVAKNKRDALSENGKKPLTNAELPLPPDDQLLCYDTLCVNIISRTEQHES